MSITDAEINEVIGTIDTKEPASMSENGLRVVKTKLTDIFSFFIENSPDIDSALTTIGLMLYDEKELLYGEDPNMDRAFDLATAKIAEHQITNKKKKR